MSAGFDTPWGRFGRIRGWFYYIWREVGPNWSWLGLTGVGFATRWCGLDQNMRRSPRLGTGSSHFGAKLSTFGARSDKLGQIGRMLDVGGLSGFGSELGSVNPKPASAKVGLSTKVMHVFVILGCARPSPG